MDLETAYRIFSDAWRLYRRYYGIRNEEDDKWVSLTEEAGALRQKYGNCHLAMELVMALLNQLDRDAPKEEGRKYDQDRAY